MHSKKIRVEMDIGFCIAHYLMTENMLRHAQPGDLGKHCSRSMSEKVYMEIFAGSEAYQGVSKNCLKCSFRNPFPAF